MLLTALAVFVDVFGKETLTAHEEAFNPDLNYHCFDIKLFKTTVKSAKDHPLIVSKLIQALQN